MTVSAAVGSTIPGWLFAWARMMFVMLISTMLRRDDTELGRLTRAMLRAVHP